MKRSEHLLPSSLVTLALVVLAASACDAPGKQIGQLDSESGDEGSDDGTPEIAESCQQGIDYVEAQFAEAGDQACAITIRSTYETGEILGWQLVCADNEAELSLEEAAAMTTWGGEDISNDERNFVFYSPPGDLGGVAVVGKRSGLLFDGGIVWHGAGDVDFPQQLEDPGLLGTGCTEGGLGPLAVELWPYDLTGSDLYGYSPQTELSIDQLWDTGVFYADVGEPAAITVLAYPRTVGDFDPAVAEVVTIIDRGV